MLGYARVMKHELISALLAGSLVASGVLGCGSSDPEDGDDDPPIEDLGPQPPCTTTAGSKVKVRRLPGRVTGAAMLVTSPPGDPRLFVVEQGGAIRIYNDENLVAAPFLDLSSAAGGPVVDGGEMGLLGLAFHPKFATNREFYVFYTADNPGSGDPYLNVVARYTASASDPMRADPNGTVVLSIPDFAANHNGGMIEFDRDGLLYIVTGDGGGGGDPRGNGQNPNRLLGKMLRIDVDNRSGGREYGIPADNPFAVSGGAPEVFMTGLRNAWRWTFDSANGDMWIGDVGQGLWEEINYVPAAQTNGGPGTPVNFGWSSWEAESCFSTNADDCNNRNGLTFPVDSRSHSQGWLAIIGGQVYRGKCYPELDGWYFYTDNARGGLFKARASATGLEVAEVPGDFPNNPASIHADSRGELYMTNLAGNLFHIEATQ